MPELCEVVLTAQYLLSKLKNKYITNIHVTSGKYTHTTLKGLELLKEKNEIIDIDTKGKFMWFTLRDPNGELIYLLNWFGLTGEWSFKTSKSDRITLEIETQPTNNELNKKYNLYFSDQRNFGIIEVTKNKSILDKKLDSLAPDFLKSNFSNEQFLEIYKNFIKKYPKKASAPIVKILLEQDVGKGIGSGLGNYLTAEILYRAKISPYRELKSLSDEEILKLSETIKLVVKMCYMTNKTGYMIKMLDFVDIHKEKVIEGIFPDYHPDIPLDTLGNFEFLVYRQKKDKLGNIVQADNIALGRTTYWVKAIQK